jgi:hypothetical protein
VASAAPTEVGDHVSAVAVPQGPGDAVVILVKHPLLGAGIAKDLLARTGVHAQLAPAGDAQAIRAALAIQPRVVIFERTDALARLDLADLAPGATVVDVSQAVVAGDAVRGCAADLDMIAALVCGENPVGI